MKIKVGIIFGGKSEEHDVSLMSAASLIKAIDKNKYELVPIGITRKGTLASRDEATNMLPEFCVRYLTEPVSIQSDGDKLISLNSSSHSRSSSIDVIFPVLHGPYGEDGTIQGLLELSGIPYVGCGVLSSALGMDKIVMKKVWLESKLPVVEFVSFLSKKWKSNPDEIRRQVEETLGYPCFVKPANLGSSIGVTKVHRPEELPQALDLAGRYDRKIVVERAVDARELECSVLGNDEPSASVVGEILPAREFYDYEAKYNDPQTRFAIPADLDNQKSEEIRRLSVHAFKALDCSGLARVDFLMEKRTEKVYLNEINTMPGFTAISMYPKLWEVSGISFPDLIDRLIGLAFERHEEKANC